jgi:hypothetical protein
MYFNLIKSRTFNSNVSAKVSNKVFVYIPALVSEYIVESDAI